MVEFLVGGILLGAVLGLALGRWAIRLGSCFLFLGLAPLACSYVYETYFYTTGDTSNFGTLATLMFIVFAPVGLLLMIFGWIRTSIIE